MNGQKIKLLRNEKGWSQADLAKFAGVSTPTIKLYESNKTSPTVSILQKLSKAFNIEIATLLDDDLKDRETDKMSVSQEKRTKCPLVQEETDKMSVSLYCDSNHKKPMNAREKLNELKDLWGLRTDEELANKLKIPKNTISTWVRRNSLPAKWEIKISHLTNSSDENPSDSILINLYEDIYASAGYGTENEDSKPIPIALGRAFLEKVLGIVSFKKLDIIRVVGDSMLPLIRDGEYVIVDRATDTKNGDTVIANIGGELYVKRLHKEPFSEWVRLESENKDYPAIEINTPERLEQFSIIGVVKCKIKLF